MSDPDGLIVYRSTERPVQSAAALSTLRRAAGELGARTAPPHAAVVALLVGLGQLEAAVVDALCPERDRPAGIADRLRRASLLAGRAVVDSWAGRDAGDSLCRIRPALDAVAASGELPLTVRARSPEGYAYYGLLPETYLAAAARFAREQRPTHVACIGIRSIGTSLSAVVAAALAAAGARVETWTVRPRGHPFDRRLQLAPALERQWAVRREWWFVVVDEGPGLSGSSFASVAAALSRLGVPSERIVLLPSWLAPARALRSPAARGWWRRLRKYAATFEEVWVRGGRLARDLRCGGLRDVSGGRWRPLLCPPGQRWPAVQAQHERRKFLGRDPDGAAVLVKFVGLGERGAAARDRAARLADAGFGPAPLGLAHGFLVTRFARGRPLDPGEVGRELLDRVAAYLAFVRRTWPAPDATPYEDLLEMLEANAGAALGIGPSALRPLRAARGAVEGGCPVALDARMLAHEWVRTPRGDLKTDATDHHDDHFFPGWQDTGWDLAAAAVELDLDAAGEEYLTRRYAALAGDPDVGRRLAFYRAAYVAHRLGYAALAAGTSPAPADRARFRRMERRYTRLLRRELRAA
jgi:hypothetical protein